MFSFSASGSTLKEVAQKAKEFADTVLSMPTQTDVLSSGQEERSTADEYGYRPQGVGRPYYKPVDDGSEWDRPALTDWLRRLTVDGRKAVRALANSGIVDSRDEPSRLGWDGSRWAGTWTGPRRQAGLVKDMRRLRSWPYGHSYDEPRKLWIHSEIAKLVLEILNP